MMPWMVPRGIAKWMSRLACTAPKLLLMPISSIAVSAMRKFPSGDFLSFGQNRIMPPIPIPAADLGATLDKSRHHCQFRTTAHDGGSPMITPADRVTPLEIRSAEQEKVIEELSA